MYRKFDHESSAGGRMRTVQIKVFMALALLGFIVGIPTPTYAMFCPSADLIHNIPLLPTAIKFYKNKRHHHRGIAYWGINKYIVTQGHSCEVKLHVAAPNREVAYDMIRDILDSVPYNRAPRFAPSSSRSTTCLYPISSHNNLKVICYRHEGVEQNQPTVTVERYYTPAPIYPPNVYYGQPTTPRFHHYGHRHGWH